MSGLSSPSVLSSLVASGERREADEEFWSSEGCLVGCLCSFRGDGVASWQGGRKNEV